MKRILYWIGLIGCLFGLLYWKNRRGYVDKTRRWYFSKSFIECGMLVLAAIFMPAIIVAYAAMWITSFFKRPSLRIGIGFAVSTILFMSIGWALEVLVIVGVFAIDLISDDFLGYLEQRQKLHSVNQDQ